MRHVAMTFGCSVILVSGLALLNSTICLPER